MKIYILTINDVNNYGNRLQNYALTELLSNYGEVSTFTHIPNIDSFSSYLRFRLGPFKSFLKKLIYRNFKSSRALLFQRVKKNIDFSSQRIDDAGLLTVFSVGKKVFDLSSVCVIGSDQVWNFHWLSKNDLALRLGTFFPGKIISYAASFGISNVDEDVIPIFRRGLARLQSISVREDDGLKLVKKISGLEASLVLDPTLMLSSDKWLQVIENSVPDDDSYVLTYFLGRPSDRQERDIQIYAKTHGCRIRRMLDLRDEETYVAGPQDFVELFSKAQYVFTDSYHACCFSILFHKQFTVFNRAGMTGKSSMNSRMETLFRLFDLDSVMMDSGLAPEIDYEKVDRLLEQHRRESQDWLDKAMKE